LSAGAIPPVKVLHLTERGQWHQERFRAAAPPGVAVRSLRPSVDGGAAVASDEAEILISERNVGVDAARIVAMPGLRLIVRLGSLSHDIDTDTARERGIVVCRQPVALCAACAEHALLLLLALRRRLLPTAHAATLGFPQRPSRPTDEDNFAFNWLGRTDVATLAGARIGLVGMGEIGAELARRLRAFEPEHVGYVKRRRLPESVEMEFGVRHGTLEDIASTSDLLVNLLPWSEATRFVIDARILGRMPAGAAVVQVGSGGTMDEDAVLAAVRSGALSGAALDTFHLEPLPADHPLAIAGRDPNSGILLTPHVAAVGRDNSPARDWDEVERFLRGEPLRHRIA